MQAHLAPTTHPKWYCDELRKAFQKMEIFVTWQVFLKNHQKKVLFQSYIRMGWALVIV